MDDLAAAVANLTDEECWDLLQERFTELGLPMKEYQIVGAGDADLMARIERAADEHGIARPIRTMIHRAFRHVKSKARGVN